VFEFDFFFLWRSWHMKIGEVLPINSMSWST
jgi:hypothetical protein